VLLQTGGVAENLLIDLYTLSIEQSSIQDGTVTLLRCLRDVEVLLFKGDVAVSYKTVRHGGALETVTRKPGSPSLPERRRATTAASPAGRCRLRTGPYPTSANWIVVAGVHC
jgi:hypothetical protein